MARNEVNRFLTGLLDEGFIFEKTVRKCTPTSGAIYFPKDLIGKKFRVILVPENSNAHTFNNRVSKMEQDMKTLIKAIEKISGKKFRSLVTQGQIEESEAPVQQEEVSEKEDKTPERQKSVGDAEITQTEPFPIEPPQEVSKIIPLDLGIKEKTGDLEDE